MQGSEIKKTLKEESCTDNGKLKTLLFVLIKSLKYQQMSTLLRPGYSSNVITAQATKIGGTGAIAFKICTFNKREGTG